MYYAMKANSERTILDTISQYVEGFEVASQGHEYAEHLHLLHILVPRLSYQGHQK
jgi:diaminopimelate decarboxylase